MPSTSSREDDRSRRRLDAMLAILNLSQIAPEADFLLLSAIDMERRSALGNRPARHCDRRRGLLRDPHGNRERNRKFVDSPLEGNGFELPVPRALRPRFRDFALARLR